MSLNQKSTPDNAGQSIGCDPKTNKRNSGLFSFLKWFKPSTSRESIDVDLQISQSSSCDSLNSTHSAGTVASFNFVPPSAYKKCVSEKCIVVQPETDTYRARLKQRDKRREHDRNLTLRKKYNLFFNKDTLLKSKEPLVIDEENSKSLPLMPRTTAMDTYEEVKVHRRTISESSKIKKAGAYLHVKGKRRAPPPPGSKLLNDNMSTASLKKKKRFAPTPPTITTNKVINTLEDGIVKVDAIVYADADIICNDSLKLDHGILKPAKEEDDKVPSTSSCSLDQNSASTASVSQTTSARSSYVEASVSPRPWYKRNTNRENTQQKKEKIDNKYEPIEVPEVQFKRNSTLDLTLEEVKVEKKKEEKRKSGLSFLTNISELDREASEIIKNKELEKNGFSDIAEMPEFMRPKESKINTDSWVSPKRRSARDLIAKFNAITNVTKVTVFGASPKDSKFFGKQTSLDEAKRRQEYLLENHKKKIEEIDKKNTPLMKSESASAIKPKPETPKLERKSWKCPKCNLENEYWRIICHVCSSIKPYFDDFSTSSKVDAKPEIKSSSPLVLKKDNSPPKKPDILERSKTQIGFSALANYNAGVRGKLEKNTTIDEQAQKDPDVRKEEKEKLKKMLIEMKNSLPKRKSNIILKQNSRASVIVENPENMDDIKEKEEHPPEEEEYAPVEVEPEEKPEKTQEERVASVLIGTTETIYENIKVKKTDNPKPIKVSSSAQTSGVLKQVLPPTTISKLIKDQTKKNSYELMRPKDFEDIYADTNSKSAARVYANLARNDELSLFFNMPKTFNKDTASSQLKEINNTDTIEINRLLRRLETAIAKGDLTEAAMFAQELAQLKVNCSVIRQKANSSIAIEGKRKGIQIEMYVEDKVSHRGPFPIEVVPEQTVAELKKQIEKEFEIPTDYQRWILGKELVTNDTSKLKDHNITKDGLPVFLYLVAPDNKTKPGNKEPNLPSTSKQETQVKQENIQNERKLKKDPTQEDKKSSEPEDTIEKVRTNVQNLQRILNENRHSPNKSEISSYFKVQDHIPKIVEVIPKTSENRPKEEVKIIPIQIENNKQAIPSKPVKTDNKEIIHKPLIINEKIVIEKKPTQSTSGIKTDKNEIRSEKSSPQILTSIEVKPKIQYVFPTIQNSYRDQFSIKDIPETPAKKIQQIPVVPKQEPTEKPCSTPTATSTIKVEIKQVEKLPSTSSNVHNIEITRDKSPALAPKANEEDFEEYDNKTLKPVKEWECHVCTLLNPDTTKVCAVCGSTRLQTDKPQSARKHVKKKAPQPIPIKDQTYRQLMDLDNTDLVENTEPFECVVCFLEVPPHDGVTLRECLHQFCKACLSNTVEFSEEAEVKCPYMDDDYTCNLALQDREIKALVTPQVYEQHLAKSVAQAENKIDKSFHCKTPDCKGWCIFEDNVNEFRCPVCKKTNCLTCQAIHMGRNCKEYQEKMNDESEIDEDARRTRDMLEEMVKNGEAIECPTCKVILMKKWGCDWLRCSMCKTEICWVTRGPRWGPAGKGDTSGGCQCGVNGIKCHPKCNYCH